MDNNGFLGCGFTIGRIKDDNGVFGAWYDMGDATQYEISENSELKEREGRRCENYGNTVDSVTLKKPAEIKVKFDSFVTATMAMFFLGDVVARSLVGGTNTDEPHLISKGFLIRTDNGNISAVDVTNSDGTITYVNDTDYKIINAKIGLIKVLVGGSMVDGEQALVDYVNGGVTSSTITGGTRSDVKVQMMMIGKNKVTQENVEVECWEASLTPDGGLDFLKPDYGEMSLGGKLNYNAEHGNSYEIRTDVKNA